MKKGDFVRAWNGERPEYPTQYFYGFFERASNSGDCLIFGDNEREWFDHAEPATTQPEWAEPRRRVIADRAKLCRVLLDMGYEPDDIGFFNGSEIPFLHEVFQFCGSPVGFQLRTGNYTLGVHIMRPEWTEEY